MGTQADIDALLNSLNPSAAAPAPKPQGAQSDIDALLNSLNSGSSAAPKSVVVAPAKPIGHGGGGGKLSQDEIDALIKAMA